MLSQAVKAVDSLLLRLDLCQFLRNLARRILLKLSGDHRKFVRTLQRTTTHTKAIPKAQAWPSVGDPTMAGLTEARNQLYGGRRVEPSLTRVYEPPGQAAAKMRQYWPVRSPSPTPDAPHAHGANHAQAITIAIAIQRLASLHHIHHTHRAMAARIAFVLLLALAVCGASARIPAHASGICPLPRT